MVREETGNLVTGKYPVFCHQVNCKGVMGAGVAKAIRNEYPEVYHEYKFLCSNGNASLGKIQPVVTSDGRICVNMFAQYSYGRDGVYTNYEAFRACLEELRAYMCTAAMSAKMQALSKKEVAFPMFIGCGYGGGNWNVMLGIIEDFAAHFPYDVILVNLKG